MFSVNVEINSNLSKYLNSKNSEQLITDAFKKIEKRWYAVADNEIQSNIGGKGELVKRRTGQLAKSVNINAFESVKTPPSCGREKRNLLFLETATERMRANLRVEKTHSA